MIELYTISHEAVNLLPREQARSRSGEHLILAKSEEVRLSCAGLSCSLTMCEGDGRRRRASRTARFYESCQTFSIMLQLLSEERTGPEEVTAPSRILALAFWGRQRASSPSTVTPGFGSRPPLARNVLEPLTERAQRPCSALQHQRLRLARRPALRGRSAALPPRRVDDGI